MLDLALVIGRFQPWHRAHAALVERALREARRVPVIVGSAFAARTPTNPFTTSERMQTIAQALDPADAARVRIEPVRDYLDDARWMRDVRSRIESFGLESPTLALVGHELDATREYLRWFDEARFIANDRIDGIDAAALRDAAFAEAQQSHRQPYAALLDEWQYLQAHRASWAQAPYPPVFVTVDALVRCANHVLVIRRGHAPGLGLLALPGGFIEIRETLLQSAVRELREETAIDVPDDELRASFVRAWPIDQPDRSQRGRTITHAHVFDLGDRPLPRVQAGDDAAHAQWVPIGDLRALEDRFLDDHFHILDHVLALTGTMAATHL